MARPESSAKFPPTRWSVVLSTRGGQDAEKAQAALAELCGVYWAPLYAYARRCGHSRHDAEDLTQGFFARLLAKDSLANADPSRGRLRSYLLRSFQYFMTEE